MSAPTMRVPLVNGGEAVIDTADEHVIRGYRWYRHPHGYASSVEEVGDRRRFVLMHRLIVGADVGVAVDHINGDRSDNRRENLRLCSASQNQANRRSGFGASRYKGVVWSKRKSCWRAQAGAGNRVYHIGYYESEDDAAIAYDAFMRDRFGSFSAPNIPGVCVSTDEARSRRILRGPRSLRGQSNPNALLTAEKVRIIRASDLSAPKLALQLGVTASSVRDVRRGRTWSWLDA